MSGLALICLLCFAKKRQRRSYHFAGGKEGLEATTHRANSELPGTTGPSPSICSTFFFFFPPPLLFFFLFFYQYWSEAAFVHRTSSIISPFLFAFHLNLQWSENCSNVLLIANRGYFL